MKQDSFPLGFIIVALLSASYFLLNAPLLTFPHSSESDIYGITYNADLLLNGLLPYRDSIELKMPGTFYLYAGVFKFMGRSIASLWQLSIFWWMALLTVTYLTAKRLTGRSAAIVSALVFGVLSTSYDLGGSYNLNYTFWMALPYAMSFMFYVYAVTSKKEKLSWKFLLMSGLSLGLALLMKRMALTGFLAFILIGAFHWRDRNHRAMVLPVSLGILLAWLPISWHYLQAGALFDLYNGLFNNSWGPVGAPYLFSGWESKGSLFVNYSRIKIFYLIFTFWLIYDLLKRKKDDQIFQGISAKALIIWIFCAHLHPLNLRFYGHYFVQGLSTVSVIIGIIVCTYFGRQDFRSRSCVALIAIALSYFAILSYTFLRYMPVRLAYTHHVQQPILLAGKWISGHTQPDDKIYTVGKIMDVYYYAKRRSFTRMFRDRSFILNIDLNDQLQAEFSSRKDIRDGFLNGWAVNPPKAVAVKTWGFSSVNLTEWPELHYILNNDYALGFSSGNRHGYVDVYLRKDAKSESILDVERNQS